MSVIEVLMHIQDGPARGDRLFAGSAPEYLRVARLRSRLAQDGWRPLTFPGDAPLPEESVWAYRRTARYPSIELRMGEHVGRADYAFIPIAGQPDDAVMREPEAWLAWVRHRQAEAKGVSHAAVS